MVGRLAAAFGVGIMIGVLGLSSLPPARPADAAAVVGAAAGGAAASLATGVSFGGWVLLTYPCVTPPGIFTVIISSRVLTLGALEPYIWLPTTITKLAGPPRPFVHILGKALPAPVGCLALTGGVVPTPVKGLPMITVGTGALPTPRGVPGV